MNTQLSPQVKFPSYNKSLSGQIGLTNDRKFPKYDREKKQCSHCKHWFPIEDMDLVNGKWICIDCEVNK